MKCVFNVDTSHTHASLKVDFGPLCKSVDEGYTSWRKPALLVWGNKDPFVDVQNAFDFLNTKRTSMKMAQFTAKVRAGSLCDAWQYMWLYRRRLYYSWDTCRKRTMLKQFTTALLSF